MREFKSLNPEGLPDTCDVEVHGEEPIVEVDDTKGLIIVSYTFPGFYISEDKQDAEGEATIFKQLIFGETAG
jgi:hypothetical protein